MEKIAIIGSGIAGLGCAYFLNQNYDVTVYEQNDYAGGHSNTVTVLEGARSVNIDTGFMVYNRVTYPNLVHLFEKLNVKSDPTSMSFSVQHAAQKLEYCGSSYNQLFAQRKNLMSPRFWRLLMQISRFNKEAYQALHQDQWQRLTVGQYIQQRGYGQDFAQLYLLPMSSAVWSAPQQTMQDFPIYTLLRFFYNHGFLGMYTQHPWWTVSGGSKQYVEKLTASFKERIRLRCAAVQISRSSNGVVVQDVQGQNQQYDRVILATHADQALALLSEPSAAEKEILGAFRYQKNSAVLHTDTSVMPQSRRAWASWNYRIEQNQSTTFSTVYWMNSLQNLNSAKNYFVSINPGTLKADSVLRTIEYYHPIFDVPAVQAQDHLNALNQTSAQRTFFCGSYFKYGFHEDAFSSAVSLCSYLLNRDVWQ